MNMDKYKVDHLILLVWGNLLPNAVAGRLLVKLGGKITLVHSAETASTAQRLDNWLKEKDSKLAVGYTEIYEINPTNIIQSLKSLLKNEKGTIGLHYMGGINAVAIHAHRIVRECGKKVVLSYLDTRTMQLVIDAESPETGQQPITEYVGRAVLLSIEEVLFLSDSDLVATREVGMPALAKAMLNSKNHSDYQAWKRFSEISIDLPQSEEIRSAIMADVENDGEKIVFHDTRYASYETGRGESLVFSPQRTSYRKALNSLISEKWLAETVFLVLQSIKDDCGLSDIAIIESNEGEFDVMVTRGCEVFVIACSSSSDAKEVRARMIELYMNAKAIGAKALVVSLLESPQSVKKIDGIEIFGKTHFQSIEGCMEMWFSKN